MDKVVGMTSAGDNKESKKMEISFPGGSNS